MSSATQPAETRAQISRWLAEILTDFYDAPKDIEKKLLHCGLDPGALNLPVEATACWERALLAVPIEDAIRLVESVAELYPDRDDLRRGLGALARIARGLSPFADPPRERAVTHTKHDA